MTHRKCTTQHIPSILALKSILAKVRDDICMRTLTVAIRQHCLQQQQTHLKDQFLSFFLTCQSKLKRNNSSEWNRVIDSEIKKIIGTDKLNTFLNLKIYKSSFCFIVAYSRLDEKTKIQEKIYQQFQDLRELQISDEVKIKTKYFFYWCQFLSEKKQIKQLKNKEIEDLKKAKIFGQYSSKFQTFMHWKHYVKGIKLIKQKAIGLEEKSKRNKLLDIFGQIKQKLEILSIEKQLSEVVKNKLQNMNLRKVFVNLKQHKQKQHSIKMSLKKKQNIWLYRFFRYISHKGVSLMNKSSVLSRQKFKIQYDRTCKKTCWMGLKKQLQHTHQQIKKVHFHLKKNSFVSYTRIITQRKQTKIQNKLITTSYKKYLFTLFCNAAQQSTENHHFLLNQIQQTKQSIIQNALKIALHSMRKFKQNQVNLSSNLQQFKLKIHSQIKSSLICRLKKIKNYKKELKFKNNYLRNGNAILLLQQRFKRYKKWKAVKKEMNELYSDKHKYSLIKIAFRGFQSYKKAKSGQLQTLNCIFKLLDTRVKLDTLDFLKKRTIEMKKLEKLTQKCQYIALKVSFITILNKMLSKKMKIKSFCAKQDLKLKRMLFGMLISNSDHLVACSEQAHLIYIKLTKRELINKLKQDMISKQKQKQVIRMIEIKQKLSFFNSLQNRKKKNLLYEQNAYNISVMVKNVRLQQFQDSVGEFISYRKEQIKKMIKTQNVIIRGYIRTMKKFLKQKKQRYLAEKQLNSYHHQLIIHIQNKKKAQALQNIVRLTDSTLNNKTNQLFSQKSKELLKLLSFNYRICKLKQYNQTSKAGQIITHLRKKSEIKQKKTKLSKFIFTETTGHSLTLIFQNVKLQEQLRLSKTQSLSSYLHQKREQTVKLSFISNLKRHHQIKENTQILVNQIARFGFKQLIQSYLVSKSKQMKEYLAIRHYATNVKRRGMRGIKYSMNVSLLKQNRTKTEFNSKMLMERSLDNVRKKSKLLQTIERYNMSRVSRVIR